jgi:hypothetical protein
VIEPDLVWRLIDESNGVARNLLRLLSFRIRAANALLRRRQKLGEFYRQLSMNDGLTGLYNRAWLNDMLPAWSHRAARTAPAVAGDDRPRPLQALQRHPRPHGRRHRPVRGGRRDPRTPAADRLSRCATAARK